MKYGICVCRLNGCGKTTLARALAEALKFRHMDAEDYYFRESANPYSNARTQEEVMKKVPVNLSGLRELFYC